MEEFKELSSAQLTELYQFSDNLPDYDIGKMNRKEALELGKQVFIKNNLRLHSIKYMGSRKLMTYDPTFNCSIDNARKYIQEVHPFNIPVLFDDYVDYNYGVCNYNHSYNYNDDATDTIFTDFILSSEVSKLTPGIYAHEITHSQLVSVPGSINSYLNDEMLPMFIEKLEALNIDPSGEILILQELQRLKTLYAKISYISECNKSTKRDSETRVASELKAEHLFDKYMESSDYEKSIILDQVQNVFDGRCSLEDLLDENEITLSNSANVKTLKKYI